MVSAITNGVKISVSQQYKQLYSDPNSESYYFSYEITIENNTPFRIQLLGRHWFIFDSATLHQEVKGAGVVGVQPTIHPNESYTYESGCQLQSLMGQMKGLYTMRNLNSGELFNVKIPAFELFVPYILN